MKHTKKLIAAGTAVLAAVTLASCSSDADVVSKNLSKAAEQFEVNRRIVVTDNFSGDILSMTEGNCSLEFPESWKAEVVCKLDNGSYIKNHIIRGDNTTIVSEQTNGTSADTMHYRTIFKPEAIVPNIDRP